jgi:hypothetical protein
MHKVSLIFSSHRPETLQISVPLMNEYDAVFLEEPPTPEFHQFFDGALSIDDYLMTLDVEYPVFARLSCHHLKQLHAQGKAIVQIEPFLEELSRIHEFFADGGKPSDIDPASIAFDVYHAEKKATGALLAYYQTVMYGSFETTIEALKVFARADAERLLLRDSMRAKALAAEVLKYDRAYVEAGEIHYALYGKLRRMLTGWARLKPVFLMAPIVKPIFGRRVLFGPGDILTLLYMHHPRFSKREADLLAARCIVFIKLLQKEELEDAPGVYPHIHDEAATLRTVQELSFDDCKNLYPYIKLAKTENARSIVHEYVRKTADDQRFKK